MFGYCSTFLIYSLLSSLSCIHTLECKSLYSPWLFQWKLGLGLFVFNKFTCKSLQFHSVQNSERKKRQNQQQKNIFKNSSWSDFSGLQKWSEKGRVWFQVSSQRCQDEGVTGWGGESQVLGIRQFRDPKDSSRNVIMKLWNKMY